LPELSADNPNSRDVRKIFELYRGSSAETWEFGLIGELAGHFKGDGSAKTMRLEKWDAGVVMLSDAYCCRWSDCVRWRLSCCVCFADVNRADVA